MSYSNYQCPVCGNQMVRDPNVFRDHTHKHIIEEIKSKHPELVSKDGSCPKCESHYQEGFVALNLKKGM